VISRLAGIAEQSGVTQSQPIEIISAWQRWHMAGATGALHSAMPSEQTSLPQPTAFIVHFCANRYFLGLGAPVPFEFAVVLGVGVALAPLGALGAWGVLVGPLACAYAPVSTNLGGSTENDKPAWKTCVSRQG
jgi:hypothetical protein